MDGSRREKLPIYPAPSPPITLVEAPPPLTEHVRVAREAVQEVYGQAQGQVNKVVGKWIKVERKLEAEIKSVLPANEPLLPGALYIGVAGLAGSVLARNRNILFRLFLPPVLAVAASPYFLPQTSANVRKYLSDIEDARFPEFSKQHTEFMKTLNESYGTATQKVGSFSGDVRKISDQVVDQVESSTGLKLGQVMGQAKEIGEAAWRQQQAQLQSAAAEVNGENAGKTSAQDGFEVVGVVREQVPVAQIVKLPPLESEK